MSDFITTTQAAKLLKVTARTIRRKVAKLDKDTSAKYVRKDGKGILISKSFVLSNFKQATPPPEPIQAPTESRTTNKVVQLYVDPVTIESYQYIIDQRDSSLFKSIKLLLPLDTG